MGTSLKKKGPVRWTWKKRRRKMASIKGRCPSLGRATKSMEVVKGQKPLKLLPKMRTLLMCLM